MPRCFADPNPIFKPAMRLIAAISQSDPMVVTTTFPHQYITDTYVRLHVPTADGMPQADGLTGYIVVTSPISFTLPYDSTLFQPFAIPVMAPPHENICAQVIPVGGDNATLLTAVQNTLPF